MGETAGAEGGANTTSVSKADYDKAVERAQRFEAQLADAQKQQERWKGLDPDAVKAKLEDYEMLRRDSTGGDPKKIQALLDQAKAEAAKDAEGIYSEKLRETTNQAEKYAKELKKLKVINPAKDEALKQGMFPSSTALFESQFESQLDLDDDGNVIVKGENGKPRRSKANPSANMSLSEFVGELANNYAECFAAKGKPGAKPEGNKSNGSVNGLDANKYLSMTAQDRAKLPPQERQAMAAQIFGIK